MLVRKALVLAGLGLAGMWWLASQGADDALRSVDLSLHEFRVPGDAAAARQEWWRLAMKPAFFAVAWVIVALGLFCDELMSLRSRWTQSGAWLLATGLGLTSTGCVKPFEPVMLEVIKPNETAFLLPLLGDPKKQAALNSEEYLRANLVQMQQVRIPQQWVQKGYQYIAYNGEWRDAAVLIRVDRSPVTRVWTADANTGTSNRDEAI